VHTDDEMHKVFDPSFLALDAFQQSKGSKWRRVRRFMERGVVMDIEKLQQSVRRLTGDVTFGTLGRVGARVLAGRSFVAAEAFARTGRIVNISTTSASSFEVPRLLNYLTAPNVVRDGSNSHSPAHTHTRACSPLSPL
jgi:predicted acylesterase/phospholipase RssA